MYPIEYKAEVYYDGKSEIVHGITFAESFTEGMKKVEDYYGDELNTITLYILEEDSCYEIELNAKEGLLKDCF